MSSSSRVLNFEILGIIDIYIPWKSWKLIILQCSVTSQEDRILIRVCVCVKKCIMFSALLNIIWFSTYTETLKIK